MGWVRENHRNKYSLPTQEKLAKILRGLKDGELRDLVMDLLYVHKDYEQLLIEISFKEEEIRKLKAENGFMLRLIEEHKIGEEG